jgi:hypothetical protein
VFSYNYKNKHNHFLLRNITLPLYNFFILVVGIVQSLFYNQKRKDLVKNQWFVISIITIFVIVISNADIASLVRVDKFGIREIYQTKNVSGTGQEWYFNTDNPSNDPRTGGENPYTKFVQKNPDGSWKVTSIEVRYGILTSSGYHPKVITTLNQMQLATKGYMQSPNDWKMTGYFKVNHFTSSTHNGAAHIELLARGGRNTNELPCMRSYYISLKYI